MKKAITWIAGIGAVIAAAIGSIFLFQKHNP